MWDELEKLLAEANEARSKRMDNTPALSRWGAAQVDLAQWAISNAPSMLAENKRLRAWQEAAFEAHPNIDLDIAALNEGKQP